MPIARVPILCLAFALASCGGSGDVPADLPAPAPLPSVDVQTDLPVFAGTMERQNVFSNGQPGVPFCDLGDAVLLRRNDGQLWQLSVGNPAGPNSTCPYAVGMVSRLGAGQTFQWSSPGAAIRVPGLAGHFSPDPGSPQFNITYPVESARDRGVSIFQTDDDRDTILTLSLLVTYDLHPASGIVDLAGMSGEWQALTTERADNWMRFVVDSNGRFTITDSQSGACQYAGMLRPRGSQLVDVEMRKPCDSTVVTATGLATLSDARSYGSGGSLYLGVSPGAPGSGSPFGLVAQRSLPGDICYHRPSACETSASTALQTHSAP
jgi:hypothetical protein